MRILIFEDNQNDIETLKNCCKKFFGKKKIEYEIDVCDSKHYLFSKINYYDLLFLDIEINSLNGIKIGLELQEQNIDCRIIITSNYAEYLVDGYKINADRYFIKPISQCDFDLEMEAIIYRYFRRYAGIFDKSICNRKIYYSEISYIESYDRKTRLHSINGNSLLTPYPLKYWVDNLVKYSFCQSHKSYLVNLGCIFGFTKQDIMLTSGELIPLSRHYKNQINEMYLEYLHNTL